ncbi:MAG: fumarylacetoacetate hydrolase family protein [Bacteroidaceae bacterium]|nr:fumarylacetoacetate hydrolase family protein [Bacteroidaceae bacterium]
MKILGVGMNYAAHNKELHDSLLKREDPVIFTKPDSALLTGDRPFFVPDGTQRCDYETELVVRINRLGKCIPERFAHRYYDEVTVGIDFTARDWQQRLRDEGLPWELCKGFDGSAAVGQWVPLAEVAGEGGVQDLHFHLEINGSVVQRGHTADMMHSVDRIVSYVSRFFTLKTGDIIFTGTPAGVGPVHLDDHLEGFLEGRRVLKFNVK